ncbi:VOC family protein [Priestia megaterium]|uniref:Putative glyoxalase/Bleomycin resistance protein/Dioxygenase family protein n=1 Tax=Priestia megaterium (strain DSM 319 / IMG 1521) TaxID=592022 RepID=D5DKD1_PRIM3|nr:VOC family protein [Priestia megaterium]ADF40650.1 putative glyoxalase/Bleomycin resistance protein/Dioxygenase family protein [Priestia megaterium DSM 319]MCR8927717.1 glyoxalase [Priestia megaterium]MDH3157272.1 glyoxalase [Priestia megaterium]MED4112323.1 glyoxalase [Priestia megaterium]MED4218288.1 glyoxalase [Priestia megaterium]
MTFTLTHIDHVQLAAPPNSESEARHFFGTVLGLTEVEKPESLKKRGGVWFEFGSYQLHIGVEPAFSPAKKAHPGFHVKNLPAFKDHLASFGISFIEDKNITGVERIYVDDPFGNRMEFLEKVNLPFSN